MELDLWINLDAVRQEKIRNLGIVVSIVFQQGQCHHLTNVIPSLVISFLFSPNNLYSFFMRPTFFVQFQCLVAF